MLSQDSPCPAAPRPSSPARPRSPRVSHEDLRAFTKTNGRLKVLRGEEGNPKPLHIAIIAGPHSLSRPARKGSGSERTGRGRDEDAEGAVRRQAEGTEEEREERREDRREEQDPNLKEAIELAVELNRGENAPTS
mmetsp:Transcript_13989/g.32213  ORF Transcript_13989/g.32213 Transcript_13989/m.32213 type:complete len:135 (-) Transcript_13989:73-477(-)